MVFILGCAAFTICSIVLFRKMKVRYAFSRGIGLAIVFSLLANICLSQNYTQSLIPEANDGIGISNWLAYWIIGEVQWSVESFKWAFERSVTFTLLLLCVYVVTLLLETAVFSRKSRDS